MKFGKVLSNQSHYTDLHHMRLVPCCYVTFVANANWIWCIQILREKWELLLSESHCARLQFLHFSAGCSQRKHEIFFMLSNNTRKITLLQPQNRSETSALLSLGWKKNSKWFSYGSSGCSSLFSSWKDVGPTNYLYVIVPFECRISHVSFLHNLFCWILGWGEEMAEGGLPKGCFCASPVL